MMHTKTVKIKGFHHTYFNSGFQSLSTKQFNLHFTCMIHGRSTFYNRSSNKYHFHFTTTTFSQNQVTKLEQILNCFTVSKEDANSQNNVSTKKMACIIRKYSYLQIIYSDKCRKFHIIMQNGSRRAPHHLLDQKHEKEFKNHEAHPYFRQRAQNLVLQTLAKISLLTFFHKKSCFAKLYGKLHY